MNLQGVYVATVTPFTASGKVSLDGLKSHLEFLAEAGVHGFVPCGTTGEASVLNAQERADVLALTLEVARQHKLQAIAGCGGNNTAAVVELVNEAKQLGYDGALVVTPYYNKPTPQGLFAHFELIANETKFPLVLYNVPGRTGVALPVDIAEKLFKIENIVAIKEATGQYAAWLSLAVTMDVKKKALLAGDDDGFAVIQALGGSGIISASANVAPKAFVALYNLTKEGKWEEAFQLQKRLYPLTRALFLESNPAPAKYAISLLRGAEPHLRLPLVPVTEATEKAIAAALKSTELLA